MIINQICKGGKVKNETLLQYQAHLEAIAEEIPEIQNTYLPREKSQFVDALARLVSMIRIPRTMPEIPFIIDCRQEPAYIHTLDTEPNPTPSDP